MLVCCVFLLHVVERFGGFFVVQLWFCVMGVFCHLSLVCQWRWSFCRFYSLADVLCFLLYYMFLKFSLMYLPVLILVCVLDFDILRAFLGWLLFLRYSLVWFLSFVHLVKLFKLFWLVCLVSGDLMFRVLSSEHYCSEWYTHIFIVMCKTSKGIYITNSIFKR